MLLPEAIIETPAPISAAAVASATIPAAKDWIAADSPDIPEAIHKLLSPPLEVHTQYPIRINSSFVLDVDDYSAFTLKEYLVRPKEKDISIVLKDSVTKDTIETYSIANARLISQEMSSNADTPLAINLRYEGYINKN